MTTPLIPETYEQWHHCITVLCEQPLTADFIEARINALNDAKDHTTQKFVKLYGEQQRVKTLQWFETARESL